MLVVLASAWDAAAAELAARWRSHGAVLVTPADLSAPGWEYRHPCGRWTGVAGGRRLDPATLDGVVTRLDVVRAADLPHVASADREYVAAEMTAFLLAWLSALACPVIDRPSPGCLCGPAWSPARWLTAAAAIGQPVAPLRLRAVPGAAARQPPADGPLVTVAGRRCLGAPHPALGERARALASAAGTALLGVRFDGGSASARIAAAGPWLAALDDEAADALLEALAAEEPRVA